MKTGSVWEVLRIFLKLGLTSFGGPVAHLGYFREEFVTRRKWLSEEDYAELVALCQFLPGPASSQVGFALGLMRAGWRGAAAAWAGFTLPSALALVIFAFAAPMISGAFGSGVLTGLKIVAVAIVAQAVFGMARSLCPDRVTAGLALLALIIVSLGGGAGAQMLAILAGGIGGFALLKGEARSGAGGAMPVSALTGVICLGLFFALLICLPLLATTPLMNLADGIYRAGAMVFGGGHVVLPLLESAVVKPGGMNADQFLAGYGAAQAVPGPLFTFAAYLGAVSEGITGALLALIAVFAPGFLLLIGVLPFRERLRRLPVAEAVIKGANAAVVGVLAAALYAPVFTSAIHGPKEFALAAGCFLLLMVWKAPALLVVLLGAAGGAALAFI